MDYYDYGLAMGLAANHLIVDYYTCNETNERTYKNIGTEKVFKDVWDKKGIVKLYVFLFGYLKAFLSAKTNLKYCTFNFWTKTIKPHRSFNSLFFHKKSGNTFTT